MNIQASNSRLQLDEHEARWFAIYSRYKREKLIRKRLVQKGVTTYLPVQQFVRHYTGKVKVVDLGGKKNNDYNQNTYLKNFLKCFFFIILQKFNFIEC